MRQLTQKKSGFTLIEIIVVLIIVGILAAIALPNLFSNIAKSKGAEALASMGAMKTTIEACGMKNGGDFTSCASAGLGFPVLAGNFSYALVTNGANGWSLVASATNAGGVISFARTAGGSTVTCTSGGAFAGIC